MIRRTRIPMCENKLLIWDSLFSLINLYDFKNKQVKKSSCTTK